MAGFLFHEVVFGPVRSRRLGLSLGINLSPVHEKYCTFNCLYCECGWTSKSPHPPVLPSREEVRWYLEKQLIQLKQEDYLPDAITFAGNGEPTMHPDFPGIVDDVIVLRNQFAPEARLTILSNATMTGNETVFGALLKLDNNIQKLDAGNEQMFKQLNHPLVPVTLDDIVRNLQRFEGRVIIQTMFLRGVLNGRSFDNSTEEEVAGWLEKVKLIRPSSVMLYSIARATPAEKLEKIPLHMLEPIAEKIRQSGIPANVFD